MSEAETEVTAPAPDCWTDATSVLLTSFWGWTPDTWGKIGWTGPQGRTRRANLLRELSDPFIAVCYVTSNKAWIERGMKGRIAGFYLVTHETGDRDEFTHPVHHGTEPGKWRHSLRAARAFSYVPEYCLAIRDFDPSVLTRALTVSSMGEIVTDRVRIERLRTTPWIEVPVYDPASSRSGATEAWEPWQGMVPAGPASAWGYTLPEGSLHLPRELYALRLDGDAALFLGRPAEGRHIYKIGLSASPELRRQTLQKYLPRGAFQWVLDRSTRRDGETPYAGFEEARAGEDAMKWHLAREAEWLGGEFYLAPPKVMDGAWALGRDAARAEAVDRQS